MRPATPNPRPPANEILQLLAAQLGKLPNRLSVEGHTDSSPYVSATGYSNWELSSDRANAARKLIQQSGVRADQVADVRGFADQRLRKPDGSHQRIQPARLHRREISERRMTQPHAAGWRSPAARQAKPAAAATAFRSKK